ncbi:MAG: hypothetical protein EPN88_04065, partial [Bacteroidetes bacterium]
GGHLPDAISASKLSHYNPLENIRCVNQLKEIREFREQLGNEILIVGWVEGPITEYIDLRKATEASIDFCLDPASVEKTMDTIVESAIEFITLQIKEGAHCIGIGDSFGSQIGPDMYNQFAFNREKQLVDHIHNMGALAKLHICGNTEAILPSIIKTGADIIDIDHLVPSMSVFKSLLGPGQVFCGKANPVSIIQDGTPEIIRQSVIDDSREAQGRCIVSAGCEITPGTSIENMHAFKTSAQTLFSS